MKGKQRKQGAALSNVQAALQSGRAAEAWDLARGLLARTPNDPKVLNIAGIAAFQSGDVETARDLLSDAVRRRPNDAELQMNLGNVLAGSGDIDAALSAYAAAHDLAPVYAEPAFNAGVLLAGQGCHADAVARFKAALDRDPDHTAATLAMAESLRLMDALSQARDVLAALVERRPENAVARTNLAAVLGGLGEVEAALAMSEAAIKSDPGLAEAHFNAGVQQLTLGDADGAVARFRHALALQPENAAAALNMGEALLMQGDMAAAERAFARALDIDPAFAKAAISHADLCLLDGRAGDAVLRIERFLAANPGEPSALAFQALALRDAGRTEEAAAIDDIARFVLPIDIAAPDGYADIADFNAALATHVVAHPTLMPSPVSHATRRGEHSGELLAGDMGPMEALADLVMDGFRTYTRRFAGEPSHPFLDRKPADVRLSIWGVVMHDGGHQVAHIHPSAWLSGVYYAEVPESVRADDPDRAGWIEFGRAPDDIHAASEPVVQTFLPGPGRMILFPSHFYHRTMPLQGSARRISVAFDVIAR